MSDGTSKRLIRVIEELRLLYPQWRIGQLVANVATWAKEPVIESIWEITDEEFIAAAEAHLERRRSEQSTGSTKQIV